MSWCPTVFDIDCVWLTALYPFSFASLLLSLYIFRYIRPLTPISAVHSLHLRCRFRHFLASNAPWYTIPWRLFGNFWTFLAIYTPFHISNPVLVRITQIIIRFSLSSHFKYFLSQVFESPALGFWQFNRAVNTYMSSSVKKPVLMLGI